MTDAAWQFDSTKLEPNERKDDGKNWARLVLKRKANGGPVPLIAVEFAREALGLPPEPQHEPGAQG